MERAYLTPDDLIRKIPGTTKGYWAQLRFTGKGPRFFKPSPKVVIYEEADVESWIEQSARTQTGEPVIA
ncbi:MAG: hypothetical protein JWN70_4321 [Planctomycetaceae bacterium]|nr:hypothetical protein [Planctomycetaceae bacterium]